jgi:hypothetical protein
MVVMVVLLLFGDLGEEFRGFFACYRRMGYNWIAMMRILRVREVLMRRKLQDEELLR